MSDQPTYQELEQRILDLENEIARAQAREEVLRKSQEDQRAIIEGTSDILYSFTPDGTITFVSPNVSEWGYVPEEVVGHGIAEFIFPEDVDAVLRDLERTVQTGESFPTVTRLKLKDGSFRYAEEFGKVFKENGRITRITGVIRDITARRLAEKALDAERDKVKTYLDIAGFIIVVLNPDQTIALINREGCKILGCSEQGAVGKNWCENFIPENVRNEVKRSFEKLTAGDIEAVEYVENAVVTKAGEERTILWHNAVLRDSEGNLLGTLSSGEDVTERKKLEEQLRESEERYRAVVNQSADGIYMADVETKRILDANPALCDMLGYSEDDMLQMAIYDFVAHDLQDIDQRLEQALRDGHARAERSYRKKDGAPLEVEVSVNLITYGGRRVFTGVSRDISGRKYLEKQLQQAQKMEAIGTLAGGIAHDFNNLLMSIQGYNSLMLLSADSDHPHYRHLLAIENAVKKAADLTKQLLGFARGGKYEVRTTDLNHLVAKTVEVFGPTRKDIMIHTNLQEALWAVEADRGQIEQVLLNLFVNAAEAMPQGGALYLHTENVTIHDGYKKPFHITPGNYVKVTVTDTGAGMDKETQKRIFEPFFSTKGIGRGTGLGLASAYGIIKGHGGFINVYSEAGKGSTFTVYLPGSRKEIRKSEGGLPEVLTGKETILFVDDEEVNREVGEALLTAMGYKALLARDGKEAVEFYHQNAESVDLVVLDMIMPRMGGGETFNKLKEINSNVKVILSSGYSIDGEASKIIERGCEGFIQKPFDVKALSRKIREVLDREPR